MKKITFIFFSLLTFSLMAQSDSTKQGRWQIGISENIGAINYGWEKHPQYNFAITAGANIEFRIYKCLSIRAGVEYLENKYEEGAQPIGCFGPFPEYVHIKYDNTYLLAPFDVKLNFLQEKKIKFFLTAGLINSFFTGSRHSVNIWGDGTITEHDYNIPLKYFQLQPTFSLGASFRLNEKLYFAVEPNTSLPNYSFNFFTGCKIGMQYSF